MAEINTPDTSCDAPTGDEPTPQASAQHRESATRINTDGEQPKTAVEAAASQATTVPPSERFVPDLIELDDDSNDNGDSGNSDNGGDSDSDSDYDPYIYM